MTIQELISLIGNLNIKVDAIAIILVAMVFYVFYRKTKKTKMLGEEKNLLKKQMVIALITFSYIIVIFDITLLNKGIYVDKNFNLKLFNSYRLIQDGFYKSSLRRIVVLNILMMVPLGLLLPHLHNKFCKAKWTIAAGITFSLIIEFTQLVTNSGVFDVDVIFNRSVGILIGYCITMSVSTVRGRSKNELSKVLKYIAPLFIIIIMFASLVLYQNIKEFGILKLPGYIKIVDKNIDINSKIEFSSEEYIKPIYKAPYLDNDEKKKFAESFFSKINIDFINVKENLHRDDIHYLLKNGNDNMLLMIKSLDGSYIYENFSKLEGIQIVNVDKKDVLAELNYFNIKIPEGAVFTSQDDNSFIWEIDKHVNEDLLTDGKLICIYNDYGTINTIQNNIITYIKIRDIHTISEKEAFEKMQKGNAWIYFTDERVNYIEVLNIYMDYKLDSKGFFRPVYIFNCKDDRGKFDIIVDALK